jgi:VanZ family protein
MAVIFTLSSIPGHHLPKVGIPHIDKLVHISEYLILGLLLTRALSGSSQKINLAKIIISAIIIASLYAIFDEWHQQYIPGRACDIFDFLSDFIGANIGILLYSLKGKYGQHKAL